jgi:hypothetical protein
MPRVMSVAEIAGWTVDGTELDDAEIVDPFSLVFEPRVEAFNTYDQARGAEDARVRFEIFEVGQPIYDLYAQPDEAHRRDKADFSKRG